MTLHRLLKIFWPVLLFSCWNNHHGSSLVMFSAVDAKVINTESSSSRVTKLVVGISQGLQWMSEWVLSSSSPSQTTETSTERRKVKLVLAGLGRTGSTSFVAALKELGYSPVHDDDITSVSDVYRDLFSGALTIPQVNEELGRRGYDAPMINLHDYVRWAATAPGDIKVILTVRDKTKWAESFRTVVGHLFVLEKLPFRWIPALRDLKDFNREVMHNVPTNGKPELYDDLATLEAGFEAWNRFVIETVPEDRLLVFNVKEGWEPLCRFLGKEVPPEDHPFPHINDRFVVQVILTFMEVVTWIWPLLFAMPFLVVFLCVRCCCFGSRPRRYEAKDHTKKNS